MPTMPDGAFGSSTPSMLAVNSGLEAFDIDACCRRRRLSLASARQDDGALHGRAFFDQIYHARRYAELLGRPVLSPQRVQHSLLEEYPSALHTFCDGDVIDEDYVSTSTSGEQCHQPSSQVCQVLRALLPASGEIHIPVEMVSRLETLVGLAERVESGHRLLNHLEPSPPGLSAMELDAHTESCTFELAFPTLLQTATNESCKSICTLTNSYTNLEKKRPSARQICELSTASQTTASQTLSASSGKERVAAQRRKGFNVTVRGGGRAAWKMIQ